MLVVRLFASILLPTVTAIAQQYVISTYAGGAPPPTPILGTIASIGSPLSVAVDAAGSVYFAGSYCIFRLDRSGILTRVAGNSRSGYSGDGGLATSAQIRPFGVAVDGAGNLYIADGGNNRIRKVTPTGIISTVAGNGSLGYSGDGGIATTARFNNPSAVALDSGGNLYIADAGNNCIRKVTPAGIVTTIAGNGSFGYSGDGGPAASAQVGDSNGMAVDRAGTLYFTNTHNARVRKVTVGGIITTVAGNGGFGYSGDGGPATTAQIGEPYGVAVDSAGDLYISDPTRGYIRKVTAAGIITTVTGTGEYGYSGEGGPATSALVAHPYGVAVDSADGLYIADSNNFRVRKVSSAGIISTVAGNGTQAYLGDGGPATSAQFTRPYGVAVDSAGSLYIADTANNRIRKVSPAGIISTVAGSGTQGYSGDGGPATSAQLASPYGVAVDSAGNFYIADRSNGRVRKVTPAGVISTIAGDGSFNYSDDGGPAISATLILPNDVAVDSSGNVYIADGSKRVRKVSPAGIISTVAGNGTQGSSGDGGPATAAQLYGPGSITVDTAGNLYIADNNRIRKVSLAGTISTAVGNGPPGYSGDGGPAAAAQLFGPGAITVDTAGDLYIADNNRIRKVGPAGIITTVAAGVSSGYSGDGGPATTALLNGPKGLAVDSTGSVYIADTGNDSVRLLRTQNSAVPILLAGGIVPVGSSIDTIQPGEWISIYGSDLAGSIVSWDGTFTTSLGGTSVTINGHAAYLSYVSPSQINLQAPDDTATGLVSVMVTTANGSGSSTVTLASVAPSFLLADGKHVAGIILRPDGSGAYGGGTYDILGPTGTSLGYATVAARAGDAIELFAVGLGSTDPAVAAGHPFTGAARTANTVTVLLNNATVAPEFAGLSGAGLYQLNLTVPAGLGTGDVPLTALVSGARTQPGVVLSLR